MPVCCFVFVVVFLCKSSDLVFPMNTYKKDSSCCMFLWHFYDTLAIYGPRMIDPTDFSEYYLVPQARQKTFMVGASHTL